MKDPAHAHEGRIRVDVETVFVAAQSDPARNRYVFAYTITIENIGDIAAQLLTRHWIITDAAGHVQEVKGEGVVGEQPHLEPGDSFRYTSGAVLDTPLGIMEGTYHMITDDGARFEAPIAAFRLAAPHALH